VLHFALAPRGALEIALVVVATIGLLWDSLFVTLGLMVYSSGSPAPGLAPVWIVAMWALLGAVGGPLAYLAGHRMGGIELPDPAIALLVQGLGWSMLMPLLTSLATRLNGFEPVVAPRSPRMGHSGPRHA